MKPRDETGALHLPLALTFMILSVAALALIGIMRQWRNLTDTQLRLDECVRKASLELRDRNRFVESSNTRMKAIRTLIAGSTVIAPEALAALRTALQVEFLRREALLRTWQVKQMTWLARRGCDGKQDFPLPLPSLSWVEEPPDTIGPKPLIWPPEVRKEHTVFLRRGPRRSIARIFVKESGQSYRGVWHAEWTSGTNFD